MPLNYSQDLPFFQKPNTRTLFDVLFKKVLFDIFDLNEIDSLNGVDIEFMIYSCILSCYKIFNVGEENNQDLISDDVHEFVEKEIKLTNEE